jgi:DNA-directed RNA polymerase specialized sigma24 family protein
MSEFAEQLWAVQRGEMTFDQLARETRGHWERLAEYLGRRWRLPGWVAREDVVQDLLLGAWEAIWHYKEGRSSIEGYVVWNACDKAKKRLHRHRGAKLHRKADSNPSRGELLYRQVWGDDGDRRAEEQTAQAPTQQEALESVEALREVLAACETEEQRSIMRVLAREGDLVNGVEQVYLSGGYGSAKEAARAVVEVVGRVAGKMADRPEVKRALEEWGAVQAA